MLSADEDILYPLDYVLLLKVTNTSQKLEVKQLFVDVDKWACKVFLPAIVDGQMTFYIFGQQVDSPDCINLKAVTVDVETFTQVGEPKQLENLLTHLKQFERYKDIDTEQVQEVNPEQEAKPAEEEKVKTWFN